MFVEKRKHTKPTIICPLTTNVQQEAKKLRVHLEQGMANVEVCSDIMIDQIRSIDNKKLIRKVGRLPDDLVERLKENLFNELDLDNRKDFSR